MQYLKVGFIKRTHGLKGDVKILPLTDESSRFKDIKDIFIEKSGVFNKYSIKFVKETPDDLIIRFSGINSIEEASNFKNCYIYIDRAKGAPLNEWEFYSEDIIGCEVFYGEKLMGIVKDLVNFGANDNLVVESNENEILFPFSRVYIDRMEIESKKIYINQIEGFFD